MSIEEREFPSIAAAALVLAEDLANILRNAISIRGRALLALSGGRTPQHVFEHLCQLDVDWNSVTVTLTDERWVAPNHPDSNAKLVKNMLLQGPASAATFIPLYTAGRTPVSGQSACEKRLQSLMMPFDAVYLGMGSDGHFASIFPGEPTIDVCDRLCIAVPETTVRLPRMSLTVNAILNARNIFLLFNGQEKYAVYLKAQKKQHHREIPIQRILSQKKVPVYVLSAP